MLMSIYFGPILTPPKNVVDIKVEVQKCDLFSNYEISVGLVYERDKNEYLLGKKPDVKH